MKTCIVNYDCSPSTQGTAAGGWRVLGQPVLPSETHVSQMTANDNDDNNQGPVGSFCLTDPHQYSFSDEDRYASRWCWSILFTKCSLCVRSYPELWHWEFYWKNSRAGEMVQLVLSVQKPNDPRSKSLERMSKLDEWYWCVQFLLLLLGVINRSRRITRSGRSTRLATWQRNTHKTLP